MKSPLAARFAASLMLVNVAAAPAASPSTQLDDGPRLASSDIGTVLRGTTAYDPRTRSYRVSGGGSDMWGHSDNFRFAWEQISGDASLGAEIQIEAPVAHPLAKAVLMFRQSLDPGSPYADIALHADGHITLQFRSTLNGETHDVLLPQHNVRFLRIARQGNVVTAYAGGPEEGRGRHGVSIAVPLTAAVYAGVGVCSHNTDVLQNVTFSGVDLRTSAIQGSR